jgi:tRNA pseudouridine38-40 synthase
LKRVKLTVAYDGTNYKGWQVQPNGITIESELNRHLSELLHEEIHVIGASRRCRSPCNGQCSGV